MEKLREALARDSIPRPCDFLRPDWGDEHRRVGIKGPVWGFLLTDRTASSRLCWGGCA